MGWIVKPDGLRAAPSKGEEVGGAPHPNPLPGREKRKIGTGFLLLQEWRRGVGIVVGLGDYGRELDVG